MNETILEWMRKSIDIAINAQNDKLCVGAILVSMNNELVASHYSGEDNKEWREGLILKIEKKYKDPMDLYLTINTLDSNRNFDIDKILSTFSIKNIYLGLPDPALTQYYSDDIMITSNNIFRYPDFLQLEILEKNKNKFYNSNQSIKSNYYYFSKKISKLVLEYLNNNGCTITLKEISENKDTEKLSSFISNKHNIKIQQAISLTNHALSYAFNEKYSNYDNSNDARLIENKWLDSFYYVYKKQTHKSLLNQTILNVGVGNGSEALLLFSNCKKTTYVDVAKDGLDNIKKTMPNASILCSRAESLECLINESYNLYVSLRTFNSSFFDYKKAISEAFRVLKPNGVFIISIANGLLNLNKNCIMPGLILPNTDFVDIYRGFGLVKTITNELINYGFKNINIHPTNIEIFVSGKK